jgi:hypothetical protein
MEFMILASTPTTADTNSDDFVQSRYRGLMIILDVTAAATPTSQIDSLNLQVKVKDSTYATIYSFGSLSINEVGQYIFLIYPGAATAGSYKSAPAQGVIPQNWRLSVDHANDIDSITYSIKGVYLL